MIQISYIMASVESERADLCAGCNLDYWLVIRRFHSEPEEVLNFLRKHGVLPLTVTCPNCAEP